MTFLEIQNAVLSDRFDSSKLADIKNWINYRYGRLWGMEAWTFKQQLTTLNFPYNTSSVSKSTLGPIKAVWDSTDSSVYNPIEAIRPEDFHGTVTIGSTGRPAAYTIIGSNIILDRPADKSRNLTVLSELPFAPLSGDTDVPLIPSEYHLTLVQGAASHGLRQENDPSWQAFEDDWNRGIEDMKRNYLTDVRIYEDSFPSWP